ncbi:DUF5615 family PIN-like protein [Rubrivirga sp.]|uniref:DUF5615 family PIN-like protein n=1 Tax=Rubrivirga sp. TaxID=1885344 RepID=UPI003B52815F
MRALVDAQLPRRLAYRFADAGWDAVHTLDLPDGNATPDAEVARRADAEDRAVVTKDADFVASHVLSRRPARLLLVSTGNLSNRGLDALIVPRLADIAATVERGARFVEVTASLLVVHG